MPKGLRGFQNGHMVSEETRRKMSLSHKGKHNSSNTKFKKGSIPWSKGKKGFFKQTDEWKERMRKRMLGNHYGLKKGQTNSGSFKKGYTYEEKFGEEKTKELRKLMSDNGKKRKGQKHNEETKNKLSIIQKGKHRSPLTEFKTGDPILKEKRAKQVLPMIDTSIELKIQKFLKQLNIDFYPHQYFYAIPHAYQVDIFVPSLTLIIECDGDYWHKYPFGNEIDKIRTKELLDKGFKVLRLWERDIRKMDLSEFKNKLQMEVENG